MNERWKELAEQATNDCMGVDVLDKQRFAELIIRECARQCLGDDCIRILNHFGVKYE